MGDSRDPGHYSSKGSRFASNNSRGDFALRNDICGRWWFVKYLQQSIDCCLLQTRDARRQRWIREGIGLVVRVERHLYDRMGGASQEVLAKCSDVAAISSDM